ncbi:MAG: hypothetical protein KF862_07240 [Chitinophagaceae bacterium]|nr:hypothetical protein [Chitinophagaceae bacterium]
MINPKDLRLGNLVTDGESIIYVEKIEPAGINGATITDHGMISDGLGEFAHFYHTITPESIDPIPITPEMLKKCGFDQVNGCYFDKTLWNKYNVLRYDNGANVFILESRNYEQAERVYLPNIIKYIHQLQNAYYILTGKELEINL